MEFITTDETGFDTGCAPRSGTVDISIGYDDKYGVSLIMPYPAFDAAKHMKKGYIYLHGTEYGGRLKRMKEDTAAGTVEFLGYTFRQMLSTRFVEPPAGAAYLYLSGTLEECMQTIVGDRFEGLFEVVGASGESVSRHQVNRYVSCLEAIESLLKSKDMRIDISADGSGELLKVKLSAVPIADYSDTAEVSQSGGVNFTITDGDPDYLYMLLLGEGNLEAREIAYLSWNNGNPVEVSSIPDGIDNDVYKYDYSSAETREDLISEGIKEFLEINSGSSQEVSIDNNRADYSIGDIVGGRSYVTGALIKEPITKKTARYEGGSLYIEYQAGE